MNHLMAGLPAIFHSGRHGSNVSRFSGVRQP